MTEVEVLVRNLTKKFKGCVAVNNISFDVSKGDFFIIVGPSPCGKSVLLKCIAGLERPDSGSVLIGGQDMANVPAYRRNLSLIFQNYALFPHMTVAQNISFGLRMRGIPREKVRGDVEEVMKLVGLEGLGKRFPRELSGGQQQRVAIARSLIIKPEVLLFDEPLGNLDYKLQMRLMTELKLLHQKLGLTFLYVTHSQEQAMSMANKLMVMNQGSLEQIGSPSEIYSHPNSVFVARFVGDINLLRGKVVSVRNGVATVETDVGRFEAKPVSEEMKGKSVAYAIRPEKMCIGGEAKDCDNRMEAKFLTEVYKGSDTSFVTQLSNGSEFKVLKQKMRVLDLGAKLGDSVRIGWRSDDALVLDKESVALGGQFCEVK